MAEITEKKRRDLQLIYGRHIKYKHSTAQPHCKKLFMFVFASSIPGGMQGTVCTLKAHPWILIRSRRDPNKSLSRSKKIPKVLLYIYNTTYSCFTS